MTPPPLGRGVVVVFTACSHWGHRSECTGCLISFLIFYWCSKLWIVEYSGTSRCGSNSFHNSTRVDPVIQWVRKVFRAPLKFLTLCYIAAICWSHLSSFSSSSMSKQHLILTEKSNFADLFYYCNQRKVINAAKYRDILDENLFQCAQELRP